MKRTSSCWLRGPLLLGVSAVVGWVTTSAVVQQRISAVWQDVPTRRVSMYPALMGRGAEARVSRLTKRESLTGFAAWLAELAAETSPDRLRAALDAVRGLPDAWRTLAAETALARLADVDPRAALDYALLRLGDGSAAWNALANVLRSRAGDGPEALRRYLLAAARQLAHGQGGVGTVAMLNPEESLAFIQRWHLPLDHPGVKECVERAVWKIAKTDPVRALRAIEGLRTKLDWQCTSTVQNIVLTWARQSPEAALQWIQQHSGNPDGLFATVTRGGFLEGVAVGRMARTDPQMLVDWLESRPGGPTQWGYPEQTALASLRKENLEAAWRVLTTVVPSHQQAAMAAGMLGRSWGELTRESNIAWVAAWPPEWRRSAPPLGNADADLRDEEFQQWLALGVKLSPSGEARVAHRVERDPAAALAEFRSSTPAAQRSALPGVIAGLVNVEPGQAAALLEELPRGEAWASAAYQLATEWNRFDRPAADTWISTLPPGTAQRLRARVTKAGAAGQ